MVSSLVVGSGSSKSISELLPSVLLRLRRSGAFLENTGPPGVAKLILPLLRAGGADDGTLGITIPFKIMSSRLSALPFGIQLPSFSLLPNFASRRLSTLQGLLRPTGYPLKTSFAEVSLFRILGIVVV